jgi:hypothetical protein
MKKFWIVLIVAVILAYNTLNYITLKSIELRVEQQEVIYTEILKDILGGR